MRGAVGPRGAAAGVTAGREPAVRKIVAFCYGCSRVRCRYSSMLILTVNVGAPSEEPAQRLSLALHPGYGDDAEVASQILELAMGAEWPLVLNASGGVVRLPNGAVRQFFVRSVR